MFFLVTGASGVGKTTVRKLLEPQLGSQVVSCELGSLGITPEWTLRWRHKALEQVVQLALKEQEKQSGKHFLLCGDPVPPGELYAAPSAAKLDGIQICLLDISAEKQTERLRLRGDPPDLIPHHIAFADWMRHHVRDHRYRPDVIINNGWEEMRWERWNAEEIRTVPWRAKIIDTSELGPNSAAQQVLSWIKQHIQPANPKAAEPAR